MLTIIFHLMVITVVVVVAIGLLGWIGYEFIAGQTDVPD